MFPVMKYLIKAIDKFNGFSIFKFKMLKRR